MEAMRARAAAKAKELAAAGAAKAEKLAAAGAAKATEAAKAVTGKDDYHFGDITKHAAKVGASKAEEVGCRAEEAIENRRLKSSGFNRNSTVEDLTAPGFSSQRQRHMCTAKELRSKGFKGKVRMICVALDYEGTPSPLSCVLDAERTSALAKRAGCNDITKLYDDQKVYDGQKLYDGRPLFPSREGLIRAVTEVGGRCDPDDYLVISYSGHGNSEDNPNAPTGVDCTLCLRDNSHEMFDVNETIDASEMSDDPMVDDELANLIISKVNPKVRILVLVDACRSGGILDMDTPGLWVGRRVCCISGCTEKQLSGDTGDGGVMTNSLLEVLQRRSVRWRRKKRNLSVQFVFNRMVAAMPPDERDEEEQEEDDDDDDWEEDSFLGSMVEGFMEGVMEGLEEDSDGWDDEDSDGYEEDEEDDDSKGQDLTLSWPQGQDPSKITFPF